MKRSRFFFFFVCFYLFFKKAGTIPQDYRASGSTMCSNLLRPGIALTLEKGGWFFFLGYRFNLTGVRGGKPWQQGRYEIVFSETTQCGALYCGNSNGFNGKIRSRSASIYNLQLFIYFEKNI